MALRCNKLVILLSLFLLLFSCFVVGNRFWENSGNIGYSQAESGFKKLFYSSNMLSNHNLSQPFSCTIDETPTFEPIIVDATGFSVVDNLIYVIVNSGTQMKVYDMDCNILYAINLPEVAKSPPVFRYVNSSSNGNILILGASSLWVYVNNGSSVFYQYNLSLGATPIVNTFACLGESGGISTGDPNNPFVNVCTYQTTNNITSIGIFINSSGTNIEKRYLKSVSTGVIGLNTGYTATGGGYFTSQNAELIYYTNDAGTINYKLIAFNPIGAILGNNPPMPVNCTASGFSGTTVTEENLKVGAASLGSSVGMNAVVYSGYVTQTGNNNLYGICNSNGVSKLVFPVGSASTTSVSNFVVADYNQDGFNEACILYSKNLTSLNSTFSCYDSSYNLILNKSLTTTTGGISMADFDDSNTNLELITMDGIFDIDTGVNLNDVSLHTADVDGVSQVVIKDASQSNFALYTQSDKILVYGFRTLVATLCGDGICSGEEGIFVCPQDCTVNESIFGGDLPVNEVCSEDINCLSGKCESGICVYKTSGDSCNGGAECLSGVCNSNGLCSKSSMWEGLTNAKNSFGFSDENSSILWSFIIAIVFAGLCSAGVGSLTNSGIAFTVTFALIFLSSIVLMTVGGWIPAYILIIIILFAVIIAVGLYFLSVSKF